MLTDTKIRNARPKDKIYKLNAGDGLYLAIRPSGSKSWIFRFQLNKSRKDITLGQYPALSIREARAIVNNARIEIQRGCDPFESRTCKMTFSQVIGIFLSKKEAILKKTSFYIYQAHFNNYILPKLGHFNISDITTQHIRDFLLKIENAGKAPTAKAIKGLVSMCMDFAIINGFIDYDPSQCLKRLIISKTKHHAYISDKETLGHLLNAISHCNSHISIVYALQLLPHVFTRQKELRLAKWQEFDFKNKVWKIPAERMKKNREHWVPLSSQVISLLKDLHRFTGHSEWVFPTYNNKPYAKSTLNYALKRLGFTPDVIVPHGFRATASTFLHEMNFDHLIIEKQLSHESQDKTAASYNHAQYLDQRHEMMQHWSNFLMSVKEQSAHYLSTAQ